MNWCFRRGEFLWRGKLFWNDEFYRIPTEAIITPFLPRLIGLSTEATTVMIIKEFCPLDDVPKPLGCLPVISPFEVELSEEEIDVEGVLYSAVDLVCLGHRFIYHLEFIIELGEIEPHWNIARCLLQCLLVKRDSISGVLLGEEISLRQFKEERVFRSPEAIEYHFLPPFVLLVEDLEEPEIGGYELRVALDYLPEGV